MASATTNNPGKLILEPNVPQMIALKFPTGKIVDSNFSEEKQVYFSLVDGRSAYVSLGVANAITNLRLDPREPFMICKRWNGEKTQKPRYDVWLTPEGEKERAAKEMASMPLEDQLAMSLTDDELRRATGTIARRPPAPAHAPPVAPPQGTGTNGPSAVPARAMPNNAPTPPLKATYAAAMTEFLLQAGRATRQAEQVLGAEGGSVRFDSRDVAAMATSMFIAADKAGYIIWPGIGR